MLSLHEQCGKGLEELVHSRKAVQTSHATCNTRRIVRFLFFFTCFGEGSSQRNECTASQTNDRWNTHGKDSYFTVPHKDKHVVCSRKLVG